MTEREQEQRVEKELNDDTVVGELVCYGAKGLLYARNVLAFELTPLHRAALERGLASPALIEAVREKCIEAGREALEKDERGTASENEWPDTPIMITRRRAHEIMESAIRALDLSGITGERADATSRCKARSANMGANDPQDCDWPFCGCDPKANKVIEVMQESGLSIVRLGAEPGSKSSAPTSVPGSASAMPVGAAAPAVPDWHDTGAPAPDGTCPGCGVATGEYHRADCRWRVRPDKYLPRAPAVRNEQPGAIIERLIRAAEYGLAWIPATEGIRLAVKESIAAGRAFLSSPSEHGAGERTAQLESALEHMRWCRSCSEGSWEDCDEGRKALALLTPASDGGTE